MPPHDRDRSGISILFVDDDASLRLVMGNEIQRMGFRVTAAASVAAARKHLKEKDYDVVILDLRMPGEGGEGFLDELKRDSPWSEVIILTAHADLPTAINCMKRGAYDFLTKPCSLDEVELLIDRAAEKRNLIARREALETPVGGGSSIGSSPAFADIRKTVARVAPTDEPVLILGESGTGKELLAREIVAKSSRAGRAFITVNCSALSETLLEAELFGHERGAFTGADRKRIGVFELAHKGTIFLDEIGDMPSAMQAKLLRTLQSGEVRPVGARENRYVDVRVISATNQDLPRMVEEGQFRSDLFYRLNVFTIYLPPLRERGEDIEALARHFLEQCNQRFERKVKLTPEVIGRLKAYPWPGNIRELENSIKRAVILAQGDSIGSDDLPPHLPGSSDSNGTPAGIETMSAAELEKVHLLRMIEACGGNKREAARRLGVSNKTLYNKLHQYGIQLDTLTAK